MTSTNPLLAVTLNNGVKDFPLWVDGGYSGISEGSLSASSIFNAGGGPGKYGDNEPGFAYNLMSDWSGGRGVEFFGDDPNRYRDARMGWTLTPRRLFPVPIPRFGSGYRAVSGELTDDITWRGLHSGTTRYVSQSFDGNDSAGSEDLTTFTEVDTPGRIAITSTTVTVTDLDRDESVSLYKDYGAAFFDELDLKFDFNFTGASHGTLTALGGVICLTADVETAIGGLATTDIAIRAQVQTGPTYQLVLLRGAVVAADTSANLSTDTVYYCVLSRSPGSGTVTLTIYSDVARATVVDTLTVTGYSTATYRYLYAMLGQNDATAARAMDYVVANIALAAGEATTAISTLANVQIPIRRKGTPGTLTVEVCSDSAGDPSTVQKTVTKTTSDLTDVISELLKFTPSSTLDVTNNTFHIKVYGAGTDNEHNCWEIGIDDSGSSAKTSTNDSTWTVASFSLQFRLTEANTVAESGFKYFIMDYALYRVGQGSAVIYMNGERGKATAATATTLEDTNGGVRGTFGSANVLANAWIKIIRGTGYSGSPRQISSHDTNTFTIATAWDITPDTTSEYIVYSTDLWVNVGSTGLTGNIYSIAVYNNITLFAQGAAINIRRMRFNAGAARPTHEFENDGTNKADFLLSANVGGTGTVIWRALHGTNLADVSKATAAAWATGHTFGTAIPTGGNSRINSLAIKSDSDVWVLKEDQIGFIDDSAADYIRLELALNAFPDPTNGKASVAHGLYLFFNYLGTVQRLFGTNLDNLDLNTGAGLPIDRQGYVSSIIPHPAGIFAAIDAGVSGRSSVMFHDGTNFHEVYRGFEDGQRISSVFWQPCEGTRPRLWIGVGSESVYMEFPQFSLSPHRDTGGSYTHEFVLETGILDMENSTMDKVLRSFSMVSQNLDGQGIEVYLDYQRDKNVGTATWVTDFGMFTKSPYDTIELGFDSVKQIIFRIRAYTNDASTPPMIFALVLKGMGILERIPFWSFRVKLGDVARGLGAADRDEFMAAVDKSNHDGATWVVKECDWSRLKGKKVIVEVPHIGADYKANQDEAITMSVTLRYVSDEKPA